MKDDLICLQEELDIIQHEKKSKKIKDKEDKLKYFMLFFYIFFFFTSMFVESSEYKGNINRISILENNFWGWTCEYCHIYNPPAVNTCQNCRRPRGY